MVVSANAHCLFRAYKYDNSVGYVYMYRYVALCIVEYSTLMILLLRLTFLFENAFFPSVACVFIEKSCYERYLSISQKDSKRYV